MTRQAAEQISARLGGRDLAELIAQIVTAHPMGALRSFYPIAVGFEDCNVAVTTSQGHYVVKIFAFDRDDGVVRRTVDILQAAIEAGVHHPELMRTAAGDIDHRLGDSGVCYLVMDEIPGSNYYDLGRPPNLDELTRLVASLARLHRCTLEPPFLLDPWAIPNLGELFRTVRIFLTSRDERAIATVLDEVSLIEPGLPTRLIHGDVTKGNVLVAGGLRVYLIDYAAANRWPRIQELAVMAANLMHGSQLELVSRVQLLADLYEEHEPLTIVERAALPVYARAAAAMELLGAVHEIELKGNLSAETAGVYEIGASGLHGGGAA